MSDGVLTELAQKKGTDRVPGLRTPDYDALRLRGTALPIRTEKNSPSKKTEDLIVHSNEEKQDANVLDLTHIGKTPFQVKGMPRPESGLQKPVRGVSEPVRSTIGGLSVPRPTPPPSSIEKAPTINVSVNISADSIAKKEDVKTTVTPPIVPNTAKSSVVAVPQVDATVKVEAPPKVPPVTPTPVVEFHPHIPATNATVSPVKPSVIFPSGPVATTAPNIPSISATQPPQQVVYVVERVVSAPQVVSTILPAAGVVPATVGVPVAGAIPMSSPPSVTIPPTVPQLVQSSAPVPLMRVENIPPQFVTMTEGVPAIPPTTPAMDAPPRVASVVLPQVASVSVPPVIQMVTPQMTVPQAKVTAVPRAPELAVSTQGIETTDVTKEPVQQAVPRAHHAVPKKPQAVGSSVVQKVVVPKETEVPFGPQANLKVAKNTSPKTLQSESHHSHSGIPTPETHPFLDEFYTLAEEAENILGQKLTPPPSVEIVKREEPIIPVMPQASADISRRVQSVSLEKEQQSEPIVATAEKKPEVKVVEVVPPQVDILPLELPEPPSVVVEKEEPSIPDQILAVQHDVQKTVERRSEIEQTMATLLHERMSQEALLAPIISEYDAVEEKRRSVEQKERATRDPLLLRSIESERWGVVGAERAIEKRLLEVRGGLENILKTIKAKEVEYGDLRQEESLLRKRIETLEIEGKRKDLLMKLDAIDKEYGGAKEVLHKLEEERRAIEHTLKRTRGEEREVEDKVSGLSRRALSRIPYEDAQRLSEEKYSLEERRHQLEEERWKEEDSSIGLTHQGDEAKKKLEEIASEKEDIERQISALSKPHALVATK